MGKKGKATEGEIDLNALRDDLRKSGEIGPDTSQRTTQILGEMPDVAI